MVVVTKANYTYRQAHIPKGTVCNRRPGLALAATSITIHNTGNPTSTAANERAWLTNTSNTRTASYHIVVDAKEAIEVLPLNEVAWHAGDGSGASSGNRTSIGIEICERDTTLGEYAQALTNAVDLVAKLLHERGWGVDRLRRHYDWSRKNCPHLMNIDGKWAGWYQFVQRVQAVLQTYDKKQVTVVVNGKQLAEPGMLLNNLTYVPLRKIAEALNAKIGWNQKTQEASIDGIVIDGIVLNDTTYVPLRLLGEEIGAKVKWDQTSYTATLIS
jgi:N-acetylmuramoyl-L-alanine amidase